jgi:hypothetical protein
LFELADKLADFYKMLVYLESAVQFNHYTTQVCNL